MRQRLLTMNRQAVATASASATAATAAIYKESVNRTGNGQIRLTGEYTGDDHAQIELRIVAGNSKRITVPTFEGVGAGRMTDVEQIGSSAQEWTFELVSLGVDTAHAEAVIDSITLRAKTAGTAGNAIHINIDQGGIAYSDSGYSLIEPIAADTERLTGPGWDWDTAVGTEDEVPVDARRIAIGESKTIHRQWKYQRGSSLEYRFMPPIATAHDTGETVWFVMGGRTVTITDGTTTETYADIVTLHDLIEKIQSLPSALVEVVGVVDATPSVDNPQAVIDLQARTDARLAYTSGEGSDAATGAADITVGANASTEIITATCVATSINDGAGLGEEKWELSASVTDLGTTVITTGELFEEQSGKFSFRIPRKLPPGYDTTQRGDITHRILYAERDDENYPSICVDAMKLGPNAEDKVIRWRYERRPQSSCPCDSLPYAKLPAACLEGGDVAAIVANPEYKLRKERLRTIYPNDTIWRASIRPQTYRETIAYLLDDIFRGTLEWPEYQLNHSYNEFDVFQAGDYKYRVTQSGTSGSAMPTFPTGIGATGSDGMLEYECVALKPLVWWDNLYDLAKQVAIHEDQASQQADTDHPFDPISFYDYLFRHRRAILAAADIYLDEAEEQPEQRSTCWLETPDPYWWVPDDPLYLPAFTNQEYASVKGPKSHPQPTLEFGFVIKVDQDCPIKPIEGDTVEIRIGNAGWEATYQPGDRINVATIAAHDIDVVGGVDGTDELTWNVTGSVSGVAAQYVVDKAAPALYDNGEIRARIIPGGVPYELGDIYRFCVEEGAFQWRLDGGAWSGDLPIADTPLGNGLTAVFRDGACPSFVAGDTVTYGIQQHNRVIGALTPTDDVYRWPGATATITLQCTGDVQFIAIAMHRLPPSASVQVTVGGDTYTPAWRRGPIVAVLPNTVADPTVVITLQNADDGQIGWIYCGTDLPIPAEAHSRQMQTNWTRRATGRTNARGIVTGHGVGWRVEWVGFITHAQHGQLIEAIDTHKTAGNLPAIWLPSDEAGHLASEVLFPDRIEATDHGGFGSEQHACIALQMELEAWQQ
jgi:hypothetical protein